MKNIKTFAEFKRQLAIDPQLLEELKKDPIKTLQEFQDPVPDTWIYRIVVGCLGFAILLVIGALIILFLKRETIDASVLTILASIASGAIGALAGLLSPAPRSSGE